MNGVFLAKTLSSWLNPSSDISLNAHTGHFCHHINSECGLKQAATHIGHIFITLLSHKVEWSNYEI